MRGKRSHKRVVTGGVTDTTSMGATWDQVTVIGDLVAKKATRHGTKITVTTFPDGSGVITVTNKRAGTGSEIDTTAAQALALADRMLDKL